MKILNVLLLAVVFISPAALFATNSLTFGNARAIYIEPAASTGLEAIYVIDGTAGVTASYSTTGNASWAKFSNLGGGYAETIASTSSGNISSITLSDNDMGYIVEVDGKQHCFWIINYAKHELVLNSLTPSSDTNCGQMVLDFDGSADEIPYYTINGRRMVLSRELEVTYSTLTFDEDSFAYIPEEVCTYVSSISSHLSVTAALQDTPVSISGDRFLSAWGEEISITSPIVTTQAVEVHARATQETSTAENEEKDQTDGLGGSAPCLVTFEAIASDAAIFHEWQISRSSEFETNENTYTDFNFEYSFSDQGTTYVRFVANNAEGTCEVTSDVFEIFIGESKLEIPNAFSPQTSPGVNDIWCVSYKSLISFECHIFNRWGTCLFSTTDPAQGWDGKYKGKYVPAGVYYYVINALGADGIKYKRSGDINIVSLKSGTSSSSSE